MLMSDIRLMDNVSMEKIRIQGKSNALRRVSDFENFDDNTDVTIKNLYMDKTINVLVLETDIDDTHLLTVKDITLSCTGRCPQCNYFAFCLDKYNKIEHWVIKDNSSKTVEEACYDSTRTY